jgi:nitroreductase
MSTSIFHLLPFLLAAFFACSSPDTGEQAMLPKLPRPRTGGGMPVRDALKNRKTTREFSTRELPAQVLSDLLWAADGINRPDGKRTAANAFNAQSIDIYVFLADGIYVYDPKNNLLTLVKTGDLRALTGPSESMKAAPLQLVYVSDFSRYDPKMIDERKFMWACYDTGFIGQNVYLFCASEKLACVVRAVNSDSLAAKMGLAPTQRIMLAQTVGYPK